MLLKINGDIFLNNIKQIVSVSGRPYRVSCEVRTKCVYLDKENGSLKGLNTSLMAWEKWNVDDYMHLVIKYGCFIDEKCCDGLGDATFFK
jgi:hypothetical protein